MKLLVKIIIIFLIFVPICLAQQQVSGTLRNFQLADGSSVQGVLIGVRASDGKYKIQSPTIGIVYIDPDNVRSMMTVSSNQASIQAPSESKTSINNMEGAQKALLSDPSIKQSVEQLAADPELMELLQDPEVMQALMSQDPAAIQSNPKIQEIMQNPKIQMLIQQSAEKLLNQK